MIKINRIKLTNFTCIDKADLDLSGDNIILIIGDNGSGKSSLLEAIAICFAERKRSSSFNEYIKLGTKESKIYMEATINDSPIIFDCRLESKAAMLFRTITWNGKEYNNSECSKLLEDLNLIFYSDIIFAMQSESDLVNMTPTQRAQFFKEVFNFKFEEGLKKIDEENDNLKNNINLLKASIEASESQLKMLNSKEFIYKELPFSESEFEIKCNELEKLEAEIEEAEKSNEVRKNLEIASNRLRESIYSSKSSLKQIDTTIKNKCSEIEQIGQKSNDLKIKKEELEKCQSGLESVKKSISDLNKNIKETQTELYSAKDIHTELSTKRKFFENKLATIMQGKCPTCEKDFTNADKQEVEDSIKEIDEKIEKSNKNIFGYNISLTSFSFELDEKNEVYNKLSKDSERLRIEVNNLESVILNVNNLRSEVENLNKEVEKINKKIVEEEADLDKTRSLLEVQVLKIDTSKMSELMSDINNYKNIIEQNESTRQSELSWVDLKKEVEIKIEDLKKNLNVANIELKNNNEVKDIIGNKLTSYIIVGICDNLTREMNNFIQTIFPHVKVSVIQLKKGIGIYYYPNTQIDKCISSKMASGFQKELISLAFRVALCKMYNMSFSFFDEIDSSSSQKNSESVVEYLFGSSMFSQLFIITQKDMTRDYIISNFSDVTLIQAKKGVLEKLSYFGD